MVGLLRIALKKGRFTSARNQIVTSISVKGSLSPRPAQLPHNEAETTIPKMQMNSPQKLY